MLKSHLDAIEKQLIASSKIPANSDHPEKTKIKYCQYDETHNDYVYTEEWVDFLISELSDATKRREVLKID